MIAEADDGAAAIGASLIGLGAARIAGDLAFALDALGEIAAILVRRLGTPLVMTRRLTSSFHGLALTSRRL